MVENVEAANRGLYLPETETLVCADLHIGRDATADTELPLGERPRLCNRMSTLLDQFSPQEVVIAGDVLHAFERIPRGVSETLTTLLGHIDEVGADLIVIEGNHDPFLTEIYDGSVTTQYRLSDDTLICHGDTTPTASADRYVIGHAHPAIVIEGQRRPCYLAGPGPRAESDLFVLPAFNDLAPGTPVNGAIQKGLPSPMLKRLDQFRPGVWDDAAEEMLWFPALDEFKRML